MVDARRELTITREYDAPRELVWKAWTDTKMLQRWWGPYGVTNPVCQFDVRPGGKINIVMKAGKELGPAEGQEWPMNGEVKEVEPQSRLVFTANAIDDVKEIMLESLVTVSFEDLKGRTRMTVHVVVTKATAKAEFALKGMEAGWNQQFDKLGKELA